MLFYLFDVMTIEYSIKVVINCIFKGDSKLTLNFILNGKQEHMIFNEHAEANGVDSVVHTQIPLQTRRTFTLPRTPKKPTASAANHQRSELSPPPGITLSWGKLPPPGLYLHSITGQCEHGKGVGTTLAGHHNFRAPCRGQLWLFLKLCQDPTSLSARSCLGNALHVLFHADLTKAF